MDCFKYKLFYMCVENHSDVPVDEFWKNMKNKNGLRLKLSFSASKHTIIEHLYYKNKSALRAQQEG